MANSSQYWREVAEAKDSEALRLALRSDDQAARTALVEIVNLLTILERTLNSSRYINQLVWVGIQIAKQTHDDYTADSLSAQLHNNSAQEALSKNDPQSAAQEFTAAASFTLKGPDVKRSIRTCHIAVTFILRLGKYEEALKVSEALLDRVELEGVTDSELAFLLYEFISVSSHAPATTAWALVLARISQLLRQQHLALATAAICRLAVLIVRMGALEEGLTLLADSLPDIQRVRLQTENGSMTEMSEVALASLAKACALDHSGRETEAENAYRDLPELLHNENAKLDAILRLAEHHIENNRLQEAIDLLEFEVEDRQYAALQMSLLSVAYALLNRFELSRAAAKQAWETLVTPTSIDADLSSFQAAAQEGMIEFEKNFVASEIEWRIKLQLAERALIANDLDDLALTSLEHGLKWAIEKGERMMEARWYRVAGEMALFANENENALAKLQKSLECNLTTNDTGDWRTLVTTVPEVLASVHKEQFRRSRIEAGVGMETLLLIGRANARLGNDPLPSWDAAIAAGRRRNRRLLLYHALVEKAQWIRTINKAESRTLWQNALDVLEGLRAEVRDVESQTGVLEDKEAAYGELLLDTVEIGDASEAVRLMERAKARALLEEITAESFRTTLDPDAENDARYLRKRLVRALRTDTGLSGNALLELNNLKDQFASLYKQASNRQSVKHLAGASASDVAAASSGKKAILHYFVSENHLIVAVAFDGELFPAVHLPCTRAQLQQLIETLRFEISTRENCHSLQSLYDALIRPVESFLDDAVELVVVPHGLLHNVPFPALRITGRQYLIDKVSVRCAPSIGVANRAGGSISQPRPNESVLIAANNTTYISLPPLEAVAREVDAISEVLEGAQVFKGTEAVRRHVLRLEKGVKILHLACHGEFDAEDALLSRAYLSDGPIYGYEIERLKSPPTIVVLSACETGLHQRVAGDETFGLVRAFLANGTKAVIASLWQVADDSTALLMSAFYKNLRRSKGSLSEALRAAQRELQKSPTYCHPFYWAPYVLIGGSVEIKESTNV